MPVSRPLRAGSARRRRALRSRGRHVQPKTGRESMQAAALGTAADLIGSEFSCTRDSWMYPCGSRIERSSWRQQGDENVVMRVGVAFVLREGLAIGDADFFTAPGAPLPAAFEVFVDAMLFEEPVALAGVTGEHFEFAFKRRRHVDDEFRLNCIAEIVDSLDGVHVIQVRNFRQRRSWLPLARGVIRD